MGQRLRENTPEVPVSRSLTSAPAPERYGSAESTNSLRPATSAPTTKEDTATVLNARRPAATEDQISEAAQVLEQLRHTRASQQHQIIGIPEQQLPGASQQQEDIRASEQQPQRREDLEERLDFLCTQRYSPYEIVHTLIPAYLDVRSRYAWRQFTRRNTFLGVRPIQRLNNAVQSNLPAYDGIIPAHVTYSLPPGEPVTAIEPNPRSHLELSFSNAQIRRIERRPQSNIDNIISPQTNLEDVDDEGEVDSMVIVSSDIHETAAAPATSNESLEGDNATISRTVTVDFVLRVNLPVRDDLPFGVDLTQGERLWMQTLRARARGRARARRRIIQRSEP